MTRENETPLASTQISESWIQDFDSPNPPDHPNARKLQTHIRFKNVPTGYRDVTLSGWVYVTAGIHHKSNRYVWLGPFMSQGGSYVRSDGPMVPTANMWSTVASTLAQHLPTPSASHCLEALQQTREKADARARSTLQQELDSNQYRHLRGLEWVDQINAQKWYIYNQERIREARYEAEEQP